MLPYERNCCEWLWQTWGDGDYRHRVNRNRDDHARHSRRRHDPQAPHTGRLRAGHDRRELLDPVTDPALTGASLDDELAAQTTPVRELVDAETSTVPADAGIYETLETSAERGVRQVILVEDSKLAGLLSR